MSNGVTQYNCRCHNLPRMASHVTDGVMIDSKLSVPYARSPRDMTS